MALTIPSSPAFPTTAEIQSAVKSYRGDSESLPAVSDELVAASRRWAYGQIFAKLNPQGYSKAQIDAWDLLWEFGRDLCLWYYWRSRIGANSGDGMDVESLPKHWNRLEELDTVLLTEDGEEIALEEAEAQVGYGDATFSGREHFNPDTEW